MIEPKSFDELLVNPRRRKAGTRGQNQMGDGRPLSSGFKQPTARVAKSSAALSKRAIRAPVPREFPPAIEAVLVYRRDPAALQAE